MTTSVFLCFVTFAVIIVGISAVEELPLHQKLQLYNGDLIPSEGSGTSWITGAELIKDVLDKILAAGYRLIDTANLYRNEEEIGRALKELLPKYNLTRSDIWITTKLAPQDQGEKAYAALQESLRKLDVEYVDLYLIHWPGSGNVTANYSLSMVTTKETHAKLRDQSWQQLVKGVKDGLARNIGVSNYLIRHLKQLLDNDHGIRPAVNQFEWNPYYHPQDLLDYCRKEGILLQAYSSLGGTRSTDLRVDPRVGDIAKKLGKTPVQVLLRWALQQKIAIIPKARSKKHIEENLALNFTIPEEDMNTLSNFDTHRKFSWNPEIIP